MLLDDLAQYIGTLGYGVPVHRGHFIETPDLAIAIRETGGFPSTHVMGGPTAVLDEPTVQIVTRAIGYQEAMALCRTLHTALDGLRGTILNGVMYGFVRAMQPPFFLQRDTNHRFECAFNLHVQRSVP